MRFASMVVLLCASLAVAREPFHLEVGANPPAFELPRLTGGKTSLASLQGKWVVLDFWATWCPPCRDELPWLVRLAKKFEARGVVFVAMNQDEVDQRAVVSEFVKTVPGLDALTVLSTTPLRDAFRVDGIPTLYVIDPKGHVYASAEGRLDETALSSMLERVTKH
ncbi:MAG: TlpA disulfide reductase family protein [Myxococcaceae bacterium]